MGAIYSKFSSGKPAVASDSSGIIGHPGKDIDASSEPSESSFTDVPLGQEVRENGSGDKESDDSHLVTSSSASGPVSSTPRKHVSGSRRNGHHDDDEEDDDDDEEDENTETEETEDTADVSLAVHPSSDMTRNGLDSSSASSHHSNGEASSQVQQEPSQHVPAATWAQVVAGMGHAGTVAGHGVTAASSASADSNDTDERESVTSDESDVVNGRRNGRGSANSRSTPRKRTSTPTQSPNKRSKADQVPIAPVVIDPNRPFLCTAPGCTWSFKALFHLNRHRKAIHGFNDPLTAASYQLLTQSGHNSAGSSVANSDDGHMNHQQHDDNGFMHLENVLIDTNSPNTY